MTPRKQISAILARLSLHYWRPDYSPEQAKLVMEDYLDDLAGHTPEQVSKACEQYRKNPDSKFFPKIGEIIELIKGPKWLQDQPRSLPVFRSSQYQLAAPRGKTKSVAEVLREHGHGELAEKWEAPKP